MNPATILVVDDSATKRYLLVSWLTRAGFTVREAETGSQALEVLHGSDVDLVVLDVKLPDMSGFEVCEKIKTDPAYGVLPVIHVSAHAVDVGDRTQGLNRGADAYLVEPIEPEELIATAQAVLRYYSARQRAELLAARMVRLAETTLEINSASTLVGLLSAAAERGVRHLRWPGGGARRDLRRGEPGRGRLARRQIAPLVAGRRATSRSARWYAPTSRPTGTSSQWPEGESVAVAAARLRDRPAAGLRRRAEQLADPGLPGAARSCPRRSRRRSRRNARTTRSTGSPSPCSAACCSRGCPTCPGLELAVRYEPAGAQTEVGGDFYELTMLDGRLLVAIGDVAGHSLHAATVMAEVRHAVRAYAVEGHPPGNRAGAGQPVHADRAAARRGHPVPAHPRPG